jgi:hypothetical protein
LQQICRSLQITTQWQEIETNFKEKNMIFKQKKMGFNPQPWPVSPNGIYLVPASDTPPITINWSWRNWLAKGKFHLLAGSPGTGKTTLAIEMAATIANGGHGGNRWPDKSIAPFGHVIIWTGEDGISDTIIPRLIAAGANMANVHIIHGTKEHGRTRAFNFSKDLASLSLELEKNDQIGLIIIDSIAQAVSGDSNKNADVRRSLEPLCELAERHQCAILGITHINKNSKGKSPLDRVTGSLAFPGVSRIVMFTVKIEGVLEEGAPQRCVLVRAKSNIGPDTGGFVYTVRPVEFQYGTQTFTSSKIEWEQTPLEGSARDIVKYAEGGGQSDDMGAVQNAEVFLKDVLVNGPQPWPLIEAKAKEAEISLASIKRAKLTLRIKSQKQTGHGPASPSFWYLPVESANNSMSSGFVREGVNPAFGRDSMSAFGNLAGPQAPYQPAYPPVAQPLVLNPNAQLAPVAPPAPVVQPLVLNPNAQLAPPAPPAPVVQPLVLNPAAQLAPPAPVASVDQVALAVKNDSRLAEAQLRQFLTACRMHYDKFAADPELKDWDSCDLIDEAIDETLKWVDDDCYNKDLYKSTLRSLNWW